MGVAVGRAAGGAVGEAVTSTLRLSCRFPWNVEGITVSGSPWNPMTTSRPVATVASITMTMLDSSGPRWARSLLTVATSPWGALGAATSALTYIGTL